jgi:hypothetical protein
VTWWRSCGPTMGVSGSLSKVGVRSRCHLNYSAVASPNAHEALIGCDQRGRRVRQLASPQRDTGAPPLSARWHALSSTHPTPCPRAPQGHGYACVHYSLSAAQVSAVYLKSSLAGLFTGLSKSSNSVWIASRSRKLSDRSSAEGRCASAPSGCGCVPCRHGVQSVLPGG